MKSANRGGHNYQAQGASGYVNEVVEDRKINAAVIKHLASLGQDPNDVTPGNCDSNSDLVYGVQMANTVLDADVFNSNHLNACYTIAEAMGCECVTYGDAASVKIADRITNNLVVLGFKRRPNKINKELYEVKATVMPSVIVEPFFVDSYADVQLYYKVGADEIGRAIAYGLIGKEFKKEVEEEILMQDYIIQYEFVADMHIAMLLAHKLGCSTQDAKTPFKYYHHYKNVIAIGGQTSKSSYTNVVIAGENRDDTLNKAKEYARSQNITWN